MKHSQPLFRGSSLAKVTVITAALLISTGASANLIVNGSFETNTAVGTCDSNLSNGTFDSRMSGVKAYGTASELDIYKAACFGPNAPIDGTTKVHLATAGPNFDGFTFDLTSSLVAGTNYNLSFYTASQTIFGNTLGTIDIGLSSVAGASGTSIFSASSSVLDTWELFNTSFVAGAGANFLSVEIDPANDSWIAVDGFKLTVAGAKEVPEPATLGLLGLGLLGLARRRRHT